MDGRFPPLGAGGGGEKKEEEMDRSNNTNQIKVYGLYFSDTGLNGWLEEMIERFNESGKPCTLFFSWHQNPVGTDETLRQLKEVLKRYKGFPVLAFSRKKLEAIFRVEGFLNVQKEVIPDEWSQCEGYDYWKNKEYEKEYENEKKRPKILFKVTKIKKIEKPFETHINTEGLQDNMYPLKDEDIFKLGSILKDVVPELVEMINTQKFRKDA